MCLRVSAGFSSLLSLKYITYSFFCLSALSLFPPCCRLSLLSSVPPPLPQAQGHPCPSLLLPSLLPSACPPDACSCCVFRGCRVCPVVSPSPWPVPSCLLCVRPIWRAPEAPRRPSVCPAVCPAACPSLVSHQAQNGVTVWADAPRVCPRPFVLLPMCCRCLFRGLSCLLPCVVWW